MRIAVGRSFNYEALLKAVVLSGYSMFFFSVIYSGRVQLYVHPRIVPYMKFGIVSMALVAVFCLKDIFKLQRRKVRFTPYLLFMLPLLMAFVLPARAIDSSSVSFGDISMSGQVQGSSQENYGGSGGTPGETQDAGTAAGNGATAQGTDNGSTRGETAKAQTDKIVMEDINFVSLVRDIYDQMDMYEGRKLEVMGFVYKNKQFGDNEFVPARLMMSCCAADLQPVGLLCRYDGTAGLKQDSWVKVTGTIRIVDFKGEKTPVIAAESVVSAEKPANEYVYP